MAIKTAMFANSTVLVCVLFTARAFAEPAVKVIDITDHTQQSQAKTGAPEQAQATIRADQKTEDTSSRQNTYLPSRPVPLRKSSAPTALDYHSKAVDLNSVYAKEPLLCAAENGIAGESYYARKDTLNPPYYGFIPGSVHGIWLRKSVIARLNEVNRQLEPFGVECFLLDGWRPIEVQRSLWSHFTAIGKQRLKTNNLAAIEKYAGKFCSDPSLYNAADATTWPTHVTGGAVDLTLRRKATGELLFMGGTFDDASDVSFTDYYERKIQSRSEPASSDVDAARNRRLLYWAMTRAGFANYPYEWWHYDWGTQMWALNDGKSVAFYGPAEAAAGNACADRVKPD